MDDGDSCVDVLSTNSTNFLHKCVGEEFICMVRFAKVKFPPQKVIYCQYPLRSNVFLILPAPKIPPALQKCGP